MRLKSLMLLSGLALCLSAMMARADAAFVLTPAALSGVGSNQVFFTGALTNTSLTDNLFLNNLQFNFAGAATNHLTARSNVFFGNVPGILLPGEIYQDVVFAVAINSACTPGNYSGTVTIQGGPDIFATNDLVSQTFQIVLAPAAVSVALIDTNLTVFWPASPAGSVLQYNCDLTTTNWLAVTNVPIVANGTNQVIFSPGAGSRFFRLQYSP